jgi:site-specific recombinase XerD
MPDVHSSAVVHRIGSDALRSDEHPNPPAYGYDDLLPLYLLKFDREQTRRAYRSDLAQFFGTDLVSLAAARAVSFVHVNEYVSLLESEGLKPSTRRRKLAAIRGFFGWLQALELVHANPADGHVVRRIRATNGIDRAITVLTKAQAQRLIDAASESGEAAVRDRALIVTLLHTVLRRSEASAMDVAHLRQVGEYTVLDLPNTKGGADQYVKVSEPASNAIAEVLDFYDISAGPIWRSLSRNDSRGNRLSGDAIYNVVRRLVGRAGISGAIGAHTLRHTGCTLAIESGASIQQVQLHARHKHLQTTMTYVHQRDRLANSAADFISLDPS